MLIETCCNKCGTTFQLELGNMSREQAEKAFQRMDENGGHCPGQHMELGGLRAMWNLDELLIRAYDLGQSIPSKAVMSDEEHVQSLQSRGKEIWDGGSNAVPELNLPSIHSVPGLRHIGSGNFASNSQLYMRCDSPKGTRFYARESR